MERYSWAKLRQLKALCEAKEEAARVAARKQALLDLIKEEEKALEKDAVSEEACGELHLLAALVEIKTLNDIYGRVKRDKKKLG